MTTANVRRCERGWAASTASYLALALAGWGWACSDKGSPAVDDASMGDAGPGPQDGGRIDAQPGEDASIAPHIDPTEDEVRFGLAARSVRITINNSGAGILRITDIRLRGGSTQTTFRLTVTGTIPRELVPFGTMSITVRFTPPDALVHSDAIVIASNDPDQPTLEIRLVGGPAPEITTTPKKLEFAASGTERLTIHNDGLGPLVVSELNVVGADGSPGGPSSDDFRISGCANLPCTPSFGPLCAPSVTCTSNNQGLDVTYANNDGSTTDSARILVRSSDPLSPVVFVDLTADASACITPTTNVRVTPQAPSVGQLVVLDAAESRPGGNATLVRYDWRWESFPTPTEPALSSTDAVQTSFTPSAVGIYRLKLSIRNSCGRDNSDDGIVRVQVQ